MRPWLLVVLAACRGGEHAAPAAPPPSLPTAPPSGAIHTVAITEAADAAITVDDGGGWRLWPALDGTRPPVVLHASVPRRVVLGRERDRDGGGLVAGVLDGAGAIELIRMTRDGVVAGRARLPPEPGFDELVAFDGGILALGRDQVVAWYDAHGTLRGRLAPLRGEFLVELAARRGRAIAGIGRSDRAAAAVRWLEVEDGALRWGAYTHLPDPLRGLALAPDHRRIGGIRAGNVGQVIALGDPKILEDDLRAGDAGEPQAIGFAAGGTAAVAGVNGIRHSPGDHVSLAPGAATSAAAFGDGLVVAGRGEALALVDRSRVRLLGYGALGVGLVVPAGAHFAMDVGHQLMWLDGRLGAARSTDAPGQHHRVAIDDRLFVELLRDPDLSREVPVRIELGDAAAGTTSSIGSWAELHGVAFEPRSRVLVIAAGPQAHRFAIDARGGATQLPSLPLGDDKSYVYPVDPAAARGVLAVAVRARRRDLEHTSFAIEVHRERGTPRREVVPGRLLGIDQAATIWLARDRTVVAMRDGEPVLRVELDLAAQIEDGAASRDGAFAVAHNEREVVAVEAGGRVRWRREVADTRLVAISGDARTVAVVTTGGLVALDAATGERRAWACGWRFGLHDSLPESTGAQCRPD